MVGDQAGIYASFPSGNAEIKKQFLEFDRTVRKKSTVIYDLSSGKSKMLRALRVNQFKKYRFWTNLSKVRARMRRP